MKSPEQIQWDRFQRVAANLIKFGEIAKVRLHQLSTLDMMGINTNDLRPALTESVKAGRVARATRLHVQSGRLGVRLSSSGTDIDLMAPAGTSPEEIQGMFSGVVIIAIGVVVVVSLVVTAIGALNEAVKVEERAKNLVAGADQLLSNDPLKKSQWESLKKTENWKVDAGLIDRLSQMGGSLLSNAGLLLAIGVVVYSFAKGSK